MLTREQILANKPRSSIVKIDSWGGDVRVQEMGVKTQIKLWAAQNANSEAVKAYEADQELPEGERKGLVKVERLNEIPLLVIFSVVDQNGDLMFSMDDYDALLEMAGTATFDIYLEALKLRTPTDVESVELEKKASARTRKKDTHSA